jgi:hypothetical protein
VYDIPGTWYSEKAFFVGSSHEVINMFEVTTIRTSYIVHQSAVTSSNRY